VSSPFDLIGLGETMLSLIATDGSLDRATTFRATIGGSESNVCVALARLGGRPAWVGRVGVDGFGERIVAALDAERVDVRWVETDPERPTGLMFRDTAGAVRYRRAGSAASVTSPAILDDVPVADARAVLTTGITAMLGREPADAAAELFERARGLRALDVNLRPGLWGSELAVELISPLIRSADLVFGGIDELRAFAPGASAEEVARALAGRGPKEVAVKRGSAGAGALDPDGRWHEVAPAPAREVDPVGAGDAFDAGYLWVRVRGGSVPDALAEGARCGAAVAGAIGDAEGVPRAVQK
jgi:2-dehydro-3-deoxygluconokinase